MPSYKEEFDFLYNQLKKMGWDGQKKLIAFAPISAIPIKNLIPEQCKIIQDLTKDHFLFCIHTVPILDISHLKIPILCGLNLKQAMAAIEISDFCISTDTGLLHAAAGYKKPTLGFFSFVDGYVYCKYYPTVEIIQKHYKDDPSWCGPCHDFTNCPKNPASKTKPCVSDIDKSMIEEKWNVLLNKYN